MCFSFRASVSRVFKTFRIVYAPKSLLIDNTDYPYLQWICATHSKRTGALNHPNEMESAYKLGYLDAQVTAYPRVKTLVFDFVGWDHKSTIDREIHHGLGGENHPAWAFKRIPEAIIRGLPAGQVEKVVEQLAPYVKGRFGTTTSHYSLNNYGRLANVSPTEVRWMDLKLKEEKHPLLEEL